MAPVNMPCADDSTIVPESGVNPPSVGSRRVIWMIACGGPAGPTTYDSVGPLGSIAAGSSWTASAPISAANTRSNWMNRMYRREELRSWLSNVKRDELWVVHAGLSWVHAWMDWPE